MKSVRLLMGGIVALTVIVTIGVMLIAGPGWAVVASTIGMLATITVSTYYLMRSVQAALQRLSRLTNRQDEIRQKQLTLETKLNDKMLSLGQSQMTIDAQRAIEDIRLASRSVNVPQAHFEQLLRTIAANTMRTEAALDDATEALTAELRKCAARDHNDLEI